jgi:hypothetical protein
MLLLPSGEKHLLRRKENDLPPDFLTGASQGIGNNQAARITSAVIGSTELFMARIAGGQTCRIERA